MVKFFHQTFNFDFPWVDQLTGKLHLVRLLLKTNSVPRWGRSFMRGNSTAYILEEIEVDPVNKIFKTTTKNITHTRLLKVVECQTLKACPDDAANRTIGYNETRIISNLGYGLSSRIESFSLTRFHDNITKSRNGLLYVLEVLREKQQLFKGQRMLA
ncbi:hypothetical protein H4219_000264 [Mycoemilia scoparia]|uniref:PRELI/MSF1 domain-containing protein n=1 Tax=Mycoemilia scoparia TaxID=417184 RepID=A0A9W8A3W7_9FUNG|nr:hypothetical protein H4219_000264 [Mycoemilia scoparia]